MVLVLKEAGIYGIDNESHNGVFTWEQIEQIIPDQSIGAVLCGMDIRMNYYKTSYAFLCLRHLPKCLFLATNSDSTFPATKGKLFPGGGATFSPLITATGMKPLILGKPETLMLDVLISKFGLDRSRTCMIGDRLDTDIQFGRRGNLKTLLVFTGVTTWEQFIDPENTVIPNYYMQSISDLFELYHETEGDISQERGEFYLGNFPL